MSGKQFHFLSKQEKVVIEDRTSKESMTLYILLASNLLKDTPTLYAPHTLSKIMTCLMWR